MAIRTINAPDNNARHGHNRATVTSAYLKDALEKGAARFKWEEKKKLSGQRKGTKVIGLGVGSAFHPAGLTGFDGLVRITPDGKLHIHTGVGNLGTYSYAGTARVAAEALQCKWENCVIERGDCRLLDVGGRIEVGLAGAEIRHVDALRFKRLGFGVDREGPRWLNAV